MKSALCYVGNKRLELQPAKAMPPAPGEVQIDVAYGGICGTDLHIFHGAMDQRVRIPQILGHEMSGVVASTGAEVASVKAGDHVVVYPLDSRGETPADRGHSHICRNLKFMGIDSPGSFQSSWTVPQENVFLLPPKVDLRTAALAEPLAVACHDVRMGGLRRGEVAIVIGGGPIGMLVALVAREAGAQVAISETNDYRREFAHGLGFEAYDPGDQRFAEWIQQQSGGSGADVVFEVSGAPAAALAMTGLLAIRGRAVLVAIYPQPVPLNLFDFFWKELQLIGTRVYERQDYHRAIELMASDTLPLKKMITNIVPLAEAPQAFDHLRGNPSAMKVLIDCR